MSTDLVFAEADIPVDVPVPSNYEYSCGECGVEIFYGGRGRKPKFCADHKKNQSSGSRATNKEPNANLAKQAAAVLSGWNSMIAVGMIVPYVPILGENPVFLPDTSKALMEADEGFNEAAYKALMSNPKLCRALLKAGGASGTIALIAAYGMLATAIVPIGVAEHKERKNANRPSE